MFYCKWMGSYLRVRRGFHQLWGHAICVSSSSVAPVNFYLETWVVNTAWMPLIPTGSSLWLLPLALQPQKSCVGWSVLHIDFSVLVDLPPGLSSPKIPAIHRTWSLCPLPQNPSTGRNNCWETLFPGPLPSLPWVTAERGPICPVDTDVSERTNIKRVSVPNGVEVGNQLIVTKKKNVL